MNCKQGDLAIVVRVNKQREQFLGVIVTCDRPGPMTNHGPTWICNELLPIVQYAEDVALRPIRDNDERDETLTWLDVPSKEVA